MRVFGLTIDPQSKTPIVVLREASGEKVHPTQKPEALLYRAVLAASKPGDTILDPFAGSGSTLRAARELGRNSYGFEVSRDFYQKANEQMLGEEASA